MAPGAAEHCRDGRASGPPDRGDAHEADLRGRHGRHQGRGTGLPAPTLIRDAGGDAAAGRCRHARPAVAGRRAGARRSPATARAAPRRRFGHATAARRWRRWPRPSPRFVASAHDIAGDRSASAAAAAPRSSPPACAAAHRPAQAHGLDARLRRRRALCRRLRHRHDALGHRHGRAQPDQPRHPAQCGAGHRRHGARNPPPAGGPSRRIGLTMFGVTTPCVTAIAEQLRDDYDCLVFHATGTGGRTMEKLVDSGLLAGRHRHHHHRGLRPAVRRRAAGGGRTASTPSPARRLPYVGSVGALDMVNFWAPETVPERYRGPAVLPAQRQCDADAHDAPTSAGRSGDWIGGKLNACDGPVRFLIPEKGVSALDIEGGAVLRPGGRRGAVRGHRRRPCAGPPTAGSSACRSTSTTRIRRRRRRRLPRHRQLGEQSWPPSHAHKSSKSSAP